MVKSVSVFTIAGLLTAGVLLHAQVLGILKHTGEKEFFAYVGTYTGPESKGIYGYRFRTVDANFEPLGLMAEVANPSSLVVHPSNMLVYAASEKDKDGKADGFLFSYAVSAKTGKLTLMNSVSTRGGGPSDLAIDHNGWMLLATNTATGSVVSFHTDGDGSIYRQSSAFVEHPKPGPKDKPGVPQPDGVVITPDNFFVFVSDLGLNKIFSYRFNPSQATFWANKPADLTLKHGEGPRHLVFRPDEKFAYGVNQKNSTVTVYSYDRVAGSISEGDTTSTLPEGFAGTNLGSDIKVHSSGKFLYVSNQGSDTIAVFSIDKKDGSLDKVQQVASQGKTLRSLEIDPTGRYLFAVNQDSHTVTTFEIDHKSGSLTPAGKPLSVHSPASLKFVPIS